MVPAQALLLNRGPVCRRCLLTNTRGVASIQHRNISQGFIRKTNEAEEAWQRRAEEIKEGKVQNTWDLLEERGYIKDTAG